jgi:hypothetical protein
MPPESTAGRALPPNSLITRFVLESGKISSGGVHWRIFIPQAGTNEVSMFEISSLECDEVWTLGRREVADPQGRQLRGRADLLVADATFSPLYVLRDEPPECHVVIRGWPAKEEAKVLQMQLAARAKPYLP